MSIYHQFWLVTRSESLSGFFLFINSSIFLSSDKIFFNPYPANVENMVGS